MKRDPMPFGLAIFLLIAGLLLGSVFTFGMQHWNAEVTREECTLIDTEFVSYQCDPTTGRENLFEDINVSAVIQNDPANVIVQGALLKAIQAVNEGKKVILFLDEYDKAREETDSFLLQFLQSGEISTGQTNSESARIQSDELKKNLQVILCKNNNREKLSGPLERRLEFIYLSEMRPQVFHTVASRAYPTEQKLVDFVALVYDIMYDSKDTPYLDLQMSSCMLLAISR